MALRSPQIASGPLADLGYTEEVSYGEIPAVPALKTCRRRSTTLGLTKDSYASEEVRRDRMVSDLRHGIRRSGGDVVTEISIGGHSDFYEALLGGAYVAPAPVSVATAGTPVTVTAIDEGVRITGFDFVPSDFQLGDSITFAGTGTVLDGAVFTLISGTGRCLTARSFVKTTLPLTTTTGTMRMKGGRCEMGSILRSFTFERAFTDIGSFLVFTGQRVSAAAIDLPATGIATTTFTFMGKDATPLRSASIDGVAEVVLDATALTSLTFNAATGVITAAAGDFVAAGFVAGDKVAFDGDGITAVQNRNVRTVVAVTATTLTVAEAIQTGGPYTTPFTVTRVGLPVYTAAPQGDALVAVSGALVLNGLPIATVTAFSLNVDNGFAGSDVVGSNVVPVMLYGNQAPVTGSLTVLFDRGGAGQTIYNAFDLEQDVTLIMRLDDPDGSDAITITLPRVKVNTSGLGDAVAEGLPVTADWQALKPLSANAIQGDSQIVISDTSVANPALPVDL